MLFSKLTPPSCTFLASHPRFQLHANTTRPIWLHLNRHLSRIGPTSKDDPGRQFIGIRAFDSGGGMESEETETTVSCSAYDWVAGRLD
jgi:hypothetical protein